MKSLIILKGLVKQKKLDWVKKQGLELFFLDYDVIRKLYSTPELLTPNANVLNFAFSDTVYRRFIEVLCNRLSKGCLVVLDIESLSFGIIEELARIFGYTIFWVVQKIPDDFLSNSKEYVSGLYPQRTKTELVKDVNNYKNLVLSLNNKLQIEQYSDVIRYWESRLRDNYKNVKNTSSILHVSDLHSNVDLYDQILFSGYDFSVIYGDYIDGPVKGGSRKLMDIALGDTRDNVIWLEGNHELRLRKYLGSIYMKGLGKDNIAETLVTGITRTFFENTAPEFSDLGPNGAKEYLDRMNKKLRLFYVINFDGTQYYCTHSGFRYLEQINPKYIGNVVYGSRNMDKIDKTFSDNIGKKKKLWSIHAHCKYPSGWVVDKYPNVMNIDPETENDVVLLIQKLNNWKVCVMSHPVEEE